MNTRHLVYGLSIGVLAALSWLILAGYMAPPALAAPDSPAGIITVCVSGSCNYRSIQQAVDAAAPGDLIKVAAGTYNGVTARLALDPYSTVVTQVVYITRSVTVRGGYTTTNSFADPPNPITNPTVVDATGKGRAVYVAGNINVTLDGLRLRNGNATTGSSGSYYFAGGGLFALTTSLTLSQSWVMANTVGPFGDGGGIYAQNATLRLVASSVTNNTADNGGGGYFYNSAVSLAQTVVTTNTATYDGGGLYAQYASFSSTGSTFRSNSAGGDGGGGYFYGSDIASFNEDTWSYNQTTGSGALMINQGGYVTVTSNNILTNTATDSAGGLYANGVFNILVQANTFLSNASVNYGGGLYCSSVSSGSILSNTFVRNSTTSQYSQGGGMYDTNCIPLVTTGNIFKANQAYYGGGVYLQSDYEVFARNTVISNTAFDGGGIYTGAYDPRIQNNVISDNGATDAGSGIYFDFNDSHFVVQNTIARNRGGDGSGVVVNDGSTVYFSNTILLSHTIGISVASGSIANLAATLWGAGVWANKQDTRGNGSILTGTINLRGDPAFISAASLDYHISLTSTARDNGIDAGAYDDIDSQPRPMGFGFDIGADEYPGVSLALSKHPWTAFANRGEWLTYTILLRNVGEANAQGVILTDTVDTGQRPLAVATSAGNCGVLTQTWGGSTACTIGAVVPNTMVALTLTVEVTSGVVPKQPIINTVNAQSIETARTIQVTTFVQDCHIKINDGPTIYTDLQTAADQANSGDLLKVAGTCLGASVRGGTRQMALLDKPLTIQGGYTPENWSTPDPLANPTTLDAWGQGRVLYITGSITQAVNGFHITGGDPAIGGLLPNGSTQGGLAVLSATVTLDNNWVYDNGQAFGDSGLYLVNSASTVSGSRIFSNTSYGILVYGGSVTLTSNTVYSHELSGIKAQSANMVLVSNTIRNNNSGSIYLDTCTAELVGNMIYSNTALAGAGITSYNSKTKLLSNIIAKNTATYFGGGAFVTGGSLIATGNTFQGNATQAPNFIGYGGGGLYLSVNGAVISGNVILSNTAGSAGGGILLFAISGTVRDNYVAGNTANIDGGGLYIRGGSSHNVRHNLFTGNTGSSGGGVACNACTADISANIFYSNTAAKGGGLRFTNSRSKLVNNVIADSRGGGILISVTIPVSVPQMLYTTLARNRGGDGSALRLEGGPATVWLTNTIIASQTIGINNVGSGSVRLQGTLWGSGEWSNAGLWVGNVITGTVDLIGDPMFRNPDSGDYHLTSGSAAIGAGVDAGVYTDIDGDTRPTALGYDIGADQYVLRKIRIYLPVVLNQP